MDAEQLQQRLLQQHNDNIIVSQQQQQVATAANGAGNYQLSTVGASKITQTLLQPATKEDITENPKHFYYIRHFADASRGSTKVLAGPNYSAPAIPPAENTPRKPPSSARELRALLPLHIFIERDFRTKHIGIQFERDMPALLSRLRFPAERYFDAIDRLNKIYAKLERVSYRTVQEFLLNFLTCYLCVPCTRSTYDMILLRADQTLVDVNTEWAGPDIRLSAKLCNPRERGYRFLELIVYDLPPDAEDETGIDEAVERVSPAFENQRVFARPTDDGDALVIAT